MLEYKSIPFEVKELVEVAGGGWEISGYASTFGGTPDSYGDVVAAGAFVDSIAHRPTKFLYEHVTPIGKQLEIREDEKGLFGRWSIVNTTTGTDAYRLALAGVLDSLSIGYLTLEADFREDGVRILRKVDLFEVSAVAIPANVNAVITDVKGFGLSYDDHLDQLRVVVGAFTDRTRSRSETLRIEAKEGRAISESRRKRMATVSGSLRSAATEIDAMLDETAPPEKAADPTAPPVPVERLHLGLELTRRRILRHGIAIGATP
jgi:HK97 family phage prohead protease